MALKPGKYDSLKPDIELTDYKTKKSYGLRLDGSGALQIGTVSQDDTVHIRAAGKRVGDFDEQRSWKGGRGIDSLSDNPEGYWDSENAWTLSSGRVHQSLLWQFSRGLKSADFDLPSKTKSLTWKPVMPGTYLSISWTSMGFVCDYIRMWIRKVGTPGTLTIRLHSDSGGNPSTVEKTMTLGVSDVDDVVSVFHKIALPSTLTMSAATYHISVYADSADNTNNHWEVGGYNGGTVGKSSADDSTWSDADFDMFFYASPADVERRWFSFFLDGAMYVADRKTGGSASQLWINGDRGIATSGGSTTLTDSAKSWTTNRWAGAFVRIIKGVGAGQIREIASNTGTALTVTSSWSVSPTSTSEYIIYGTEWFTEITSTGLGVISSSPLVVNGIVYFPIVSGGLIRRMIWNPATPGYSFANDGGSVADFLESISTPTGTFVASAKLNGDVTWAPATAWSATPADLVFGIIKHVGSSTHNVTGILQRESLLWIFKEDGIWNMDANLNALSVSGGFSKNPSSYNGRSAVVHQQFLYYSWGHTLIRAYGVSHDDVGQDWSGHGLPEGREGYVSSLDSYTSALFVGTDAGEGVSSVHIFDGIGWHEVFRGFGAGENVTRVTIQPCQGTRNRTWIHCGDVFVFQEMPYLKSSPRLDSGVRYMHEAVIESSAIDMGTASGLPKFIKELTVFSKNLGVGQTIAVDYQVDDDVHTSSWTQATELHTSPESTAFLGLENIRKFAYRLRIHSSDNTVPVEILGVVPNGYARVPFKMMWTLRCRADNVITNGKYAKPDELMRWLLDNARYPGRIEMTSQYELAHKYFVIVHPPRMFPYKPGFAGQPEESVFTIALEEA